MKRLTRVLFLFLILLASAGNAVGQKYAYVNTDYVLKHLSDYVQAQQKLDRYVSDWQKEIEGLYQELETMRSNYQQEAYLLPENLKKHHEEQLRDKQKEIVELQQKRFASGGDMDKKRAELLKPVQERVYGAIERLAREKGYAFVFDRSASSTVLFASEKYDISGQVLELLGYHGGDAKPDGTPKAQ